ncbi:hypothetical protein [Methylomonas koyamae]|uniref:F5/8 type C domain-containing protein n=2 Tax=Methylomonas koyamae TaxID=702114 RepID=A0AA91DAY1_9GAMM|nr:hypothetical protein [Methylomonas koyamae]OAI24335.1 hypothetical protein A1356_01090 [Methylomonas koyamae]
MICFARLRSTAAALALVLLTQPALAGTILSPIAVLNNTIGNYKGIAGFPEDTDETPMFNQSGLSLGFTSGVTDFAAYIASKPTHIGGTPEIGNGWISPAYCPCTGTLDFDLGANYSIKQMALWNMAANSGANVAEINLYSSKTADFAAPTAIGLFTNPEMPDDNRPRAPYPATVFDLDDSVGRYVRLQINSYYEAYLVSEIGEIAFDVSAVPRPPMLWLFAAASFGILSAGRQRQITALN